MKIKYYSARVSHASPPPRAEHFGAQRRKGIRGDFAPRALFRHASIIFMSAYNTIQSTMESANANEKDYCVVDHKSRCTTSRVSSDLPDWVIHEYADSVVIVDEDTYASVVKCGAANWARLEYVQNHKTK